MQRQADRFVQSAEIVQALAQQITTGKQNRSFVVVLSPVVSIPTELEKLFVVVEHDLPGREQLEQIARGIATEEGELPDGDGPVLDGLIEVEKLTIVILSDESLGQDSMPSGSPASAASPSPGELSGVGPNSAGSSRTSCSSPYPTDLDFDSVRPALICCGWDCNWIVIWKSMSVARRCRCGNSFDCRAFGLASNRPTLPASPATGRNWRPTAVAPASRPLDCWKGYAANTSVS